jgi:UDP-glucose 4-epimerase
MMMEMDVPMRDEAPLRHLRVLVTGATGFIGQHLCRKLVALGATTYGLSRSASVATVPAGVIPLAADVTQRETVVMALKRVRPSHVVHLAAVGVNQPFLEEAAQINVQGTLNVLEASQAVHIRRFVHVGTCYEYTADLNQASKYAASKLKSWSAWHAFVTTHSVQSAALRLFHVYGPAQPTTGLIASAILAALRGERFVMTPGEQERDFVFIDDVVEALLATLTSSFTGVATYDVGTGVGYSVRSVVCRIFEKVGGAGEVLAGALPYRHGEIMHLVAKPQPAARDLAWQARTDLETGLTLAIDWQRRQLMAQITGMEHTLA